MKILREYVWDTIKHNRRTSISIMIALFLMTTLMSCFSGFAYTMWTDSIVLTKRDTGDWHGALPAPIPGKDVEKAKYYASVSDVLLKGPENTVKLDTKGPRTFLAFQKANKEYWAYMPEKDLITEGRVPKKENELAVSKQYFADHPKAQIGSKLTLTVGRFTIVGKMDTVTPSLKAYSAMGYLSPESIKKEKQLSVLLRFDPMSSVYKKLPSLAKSLGFEKDEYGSYGEKYNTDLLTRYAVFSPDQKEMLMRLDAYAIPLMFLAIAILLIAVFVLVIHNAFALSASEKLSQLGTLSGIGASPKQIRSAVTMEALLLMAVPLPLGILSGWLLDKGLFELINSSNDIGRSAPDIVLTFGLPAILPAALLSVLTVWLSARIPAKKAAKMMPVEAIRPSSGLSGKRFRASRLPGLLGITGELAAGALAARKKSYRTAAVSLCMSFLLLTGFLYIVTAQKASEAVYQGAEEKVRHISASITSDRKPDQLAMEAMKNIPGITSCTIYDTLPCAVWVTDEDTSGDIVKHFGGFDQIAEQNKYSLIERDGKYRIFTNLIGLEEDNFRDYCKKMGLDADEYFEDPSKAIFYNRTEDPDDSTKKKKIYREMLKLNKGQTLTFTEKAYDQDTGNYEFPLTAGAVVKELPSGSMVFPRFTLTAVMPMEHVLKTAASCSVKRQTTANKLTTVFLTDTDGGISEARIRKASDHLNDILSKYYAAGDYTLSDLETERKMKEDAGRAMNVIVGFLTGLLALIGLSNIWASIIGNLRQRSREFAMLKSCGLSPGQLRKMLFLEGLTLGLKPLILSLPFQFVILGLFLSINEITLPEYLPYAPVSIILGYTALNILSVMGAYYVGGRRLQRENIIEAIRNETV